MWQGQDELCEVVVKAFDRIAGAIGLKDVDGQKCCKAN